MCSNMITDLCFGLQIRGVARIFPWAGEGGGGGGGGGGLSDCFREMFTSSRQTGTYQRVLVE